MISTHNPYGFNPQAHSRAVSVSSLDSLHTSLTSNDLKLESSIGDISKASLSSHKRFLGSETSSRAAPLHQQTKLTQSTWLSDKSEKASPRSVTDPVAYSATAKQPTALQLQALKKAIHAPYRTPQQLSLEKLKFAITALSKNNQLEPKDLEKLFDIYAANHLQRRSIFRQSSESKINGSAPNKSSANLGEKYAAFLSMVQDLFNDVITDQANTESLAHATLSALKNVTSMHSIGTTLKQLFSGVNLESKKMLSGHFLTTNYPNTFALSRGQTKADDTGASSFPLTEFFDAKTQYVLANKELDQKSLNQSVNKDRAADAVHVKLSVPTRDLMEKLAKTYQETSSNPSQMLRDLFVSARFFDYTMDLKDTFFVLNLLADHKALEASDLANILGAFARQPAVLSPRVTESTQDEPAVSNKLADQVSSITSSFRFFSPTEAKTDTKKVKQSPIDGLKDQIVAFVGKKNISTALRRAATNAYLEAIYKSSPSRSRKMLEKFGAELPEAIKAEISAYPTKINMGNQLAIANIPGPTTQPLGKFF